MGKFPARLPRSRQRLPRSRLAGQPGYRDHMNRPLVVMFLQRNYNVVFALLFTNNPDVIICGHITHMSRCPYPRTW